MLRSPLYYEALFNDARWWADANDVYRHGPTVCPLTVPPVLRVDSLVARNIRLFGVPWVSVYHFRA